MNKKPLYFLAVAVLIIILYNLLGNKSSDILRIAVASNFSETVKEIADIFEQETGISPVLIFASTGKLYAQISNGAPYDIFLAADKKRPMLLEAEGLALKGSRFTYALGKLVLWSPETGYVENAGEVLHKKEFEHLAIANPKFAPYGRAAKEVMQKLGVWDDLSGKIAYGENISQAFNFIQSSNAQLGFIAYTQLVSHNFKSAGSYWEIPENLYSPIEQQAILLTEKEEAHSFFIYLQSPEAQKIITEYGYIIP